MREETNALYGWNIIEIKELCRKYNKNFEEVCERLRRGWTLLEALDIELNPDDKKKALKLEEEHKLKLLLQQYYLKSIDERINEARNHANANKKKKIFRDEQIR